MQLIMENIRGFAGRHTVPIKPLTVLIGENSSGKTTFLAALSAACDPIGFPMRPRFNEPPYSLGSFDTIATHKGGRAGRAKSFSLGYIRTLNQQEDVAEVVAAYVPNLGQVELSEVLAATPFGTAYFKVIDRRGMQTLRLTIISGEKNSTFEVSLDSLVQEMGARASFFFTEALFRKFYIAATYQSRDQDNRLDSETLYEIGSFILRSVPRRALSIAPIRTKPKRTYDEFTEEFTPEGDHIPFVLLKYLTEQSSSNEGQSLKSALERFGKESGLFKKLGIRKLGDKISDPIQVMITGTGQPANLLDVGYGVSQALPVVVQCILAAGERMLLLQQPEVHLHPRAQAALGSFFVDLAVESHKSFVVETHSDYIVDRIRQEVAAGKIPAEDVAILYFERQGSETAIYPLQLDKLGNVLDAPPTYREFFLREELNLLRRTLK